MRMSAIGPKRTFLFALHMSALGGKADISINSPWPPGKATKGLGDGHNRGRIARVSRSWDQARQRPRGPSLKFKMLWRSLSGSGRHYMATLFATGRVVTLCGDLLDQRRIATRAPFST